MVEYLGLPISPNGDHRSELNPEIRRIAYCIDTLGEINGVACTYNDTAKVLKSWGREVVVLHPGMFPNLLNPVDGMTRLSWVTRRAMRGILSELKPDAIHIDTEGPIGLAAIRAARDLGMSVSTCMHTRWDLYLQQMLFIPPFLTWKYLDWFHGSASRILVPSASIEQILHHRALTQTALWTRGVDMELFRPRPKTDVPWPRPMLLFVGRISKEKNLESLLSSDLPGTLVIVGRGPALQSYLRKYSGLIAKGKVVFLGERRGEALASLYSNADLFVFPSLTETFGRVIVEALASGVPVVSYPAPGPVDILKDKRVGIVSTNFSEGIQTALECCEPQACIEVAMQYSWEHATAEFLSSLIPIRW